MQAIEIATLGGGCFWCLEAVFEELRGVLQVESGYAGGTTPNPTYEQVCTGRTGHAEVVQIHFDPAAIGYESILQVFFSIHDPTTRDRQGGDVGSQYRSIVLFHSEEQKRVAAQVMAAITAAGLYGAPLVTQVVPLQVFYRAELYHQGYFRSNPSQPYCAAVVAPKVAKFRKQHLDMLRR